MTRRVGNVVIIEAEAPQQCDFCGTIDELRPYGPNGECICFACAHKDAAAAAATERAFDKLFGVKAPGT